MTNPTGDQNPGRPPTLDDAKRKTILAMLANGTPSTARGFATDPTKAVDYFGESPSPQLTDEQALPEIAADATETAL